MSPNQVPFEIEDVLQGPPTRPVHYRIAVDSRTVVKYLTAPAPMSGFPDVNGDRLGFRTVPDGDWDEAMLAVDAADGKLHVVSCAKRELPDVSPAWHPTSVDLVTLRSLWRQVYRQRGTDVDFNDRPGRLQIKGHLPSEIFPAPKELGLDRVAAFWDVSFKGISKHALARECHIYSLLRDASFAPRFVAHLRDNGRRIVGHLLEAVPAREATVDDVDLCKTALKELHARGIGLGYITSRTFIIRDDKSPPVAQIQHYYSARETTDQAVLDEEMASVEEALRQGPWKAPEYSQKIQDQLTAMHKRDGYVHPTTHMLIERYGRITISPEDHRAMLKDLEKKGWVSTLADREEELARLERNGGHWYPTSEAAKI